MVTRAQKHEISLAKIQEIANAYDWVADAHLCFHLPVSALRPDHKEFLKRHGIDTRPYADGRFAVLESDYPAKLPLTDALENAIRNRYRNETTPEQWKAIAEKYDWVCFDPESRPDQYVCEVSILSPDVQFFRQTATADPGWLPVHPGELLADDLLYWDISIEALSERLGIARERLDLLIEEKSDMTRDIAQKIAEFTGFPTDADHWMNRQRAYEQNTARYITLECFGPSPLNAAIKAKLDRNRGAENPASDLLIETAIDQATTTEARLPQIVL